MGRAVETGKYKNPNGTWSRITKYVNYKTTASGLIEEGEWLRMYKECLIKEGYMLFIGIMGIYVRENCVWLKTDADIEKYCIEAFDYGSFRYWFERALKESEVVAAADEEEIGLTKEETSGNDRNRSKVGGHDGR